MKKVLKGLGKPVIYTALGALIGYLYFAVVGCRTGNCAITSSPINSMIYFGFFGLLMSGPLCPACRNGSCDIDTTSKSAYTDIEQSRLIDAEDE